MHLPQYTQQVVLVVDQEHTPLKTRRRSEPNHRLVPQIPAHQIL